VNDLADVAPGLLSRGAKRVVEDFCLAIRVLIVEDDLMDAHLLEKVILGLVCRLGHLGLKLARSWGDHGLLLLLLLFGSELVCWAWLKNKATKSRRLFSVIWELRCTIG